MPHQEMSGGLAKVHKKPRRGGGDAGAKYMTKVPSRDRGTGLTIRSADWRPDNRLKRQKFSKVVANKSWAGACKCTRRERGVGRTLAVLTSQAFHSPSGIRRHDCRQ